MPQTRCRPTTLAIRFALLLAATGCATGPPPAAPLGPPTLHEKLGWILRLEDQRVLRDPAAPPRPETPAEPQPAHDPDAVSGPAPASGVEDPPPATRRPVPDLRDLLTDAAPRIRRRAALAVGRVGHADGVKPVLSVGENLAFWAAISETRSETVGHRVQTALSRVGLDSLSEMPARFLSAGQRRRLNLARLLAAPARLWLLDEPAAGLDEGSAAVLESMIASHLARGGMAVVATHDAVPAGARRLELP